MHTNTKSDDWLAACKLVLAAFYWSLPEISPIHPCSGGGHRYISPSPPRSHLLQPRLNNVCDTHIISSSLYLALFLHCSLAFANFLSGPVFFPAWLIAFDLIQLCYLSGVYCIFLRGCACCWHQVLPQQLDTVYSIQIYNTIIQWILVQVFSLCCRILCRMTQVMVCLQFDWLFAGLRKNYWTDFHDIVWRGAAEPKEGPIAFWSRSS